MPKPFKLTSEISDFILKEKKNNPGFGCRTLGLMVKQRFGKDVSKSAVNALIKAKGMSKSVGRPKKPKQGSSELVYDIDCAGSFFLRGTDEQVSLSVILRQFSRNALKHSNAKSLEYKNNIGLYWPVFNPEGIDKLNYYKGFGLWYMASNGRKISKSSVIKYLDSIEALGVTPSVIKGLEIGVEFVHFISIHSTKGEPFYIDPGFHLIWQQPKGVALHCLPIIKAEKVIRDVLFSNEPLILLTSKPYQPLSRDLASFFTAWCNIEANSIRAVGLLDSNGAELGRINKVPSRKRDFIFAVLPWQLGDIRFSTPLSAAVKVKLGPTGEEFMIEPSVADLSQTIGIKDFKLRAIALKNISAQPRVSLITNIASDEKSDLEVANLYLKRWPNLEESFEDMLKKLEFIKYPQLAKDYKFFNSNNLRILLPQQRLSFQSLLAHLLDYLNTLCQVRYFPLDYQNTLGLSDMRTRFYSLSGRVVETENQISASLFYPPNYAFKQDLIYACRRFNEDYCLFKNKRLFLMPQSR